MIGMGIMAGICTSSYPVNAKIFHQNGDEFICHL